MFKKQLMKVLCLAMTAVMVAGLNVIPVMAEEDGIVIQAIENEEESTYITYDEAEDSEDNVNMDEDSIPTTTETIPLINEPAEGNIIFGLEGDFRTETAEKILKRVNEIRYEACKEGVKNPVTKEKLTLDDYVPVKWSLELESLARQRAAEASMFVNHTRLNDKSCFSLKTIDNFSSGGEVLAWNSNRDGFMYGIEQWYGEKNDWVNNTGGVTGHYTMMISPNTKSLGYACFKNKTDSWMCVAGEYGGESRNEKKCSFSGEATAQIEVAGKYVDSLTLADDSKNIKIKAGNAKNIILNTKISHEYYDGQVESRTGKVLKANWKSANTNIATVKNNGHVIGVANGSTTISCTIGSKTVTVNVEVSDDAPNTNDPEPEVGKEPSGGETPEEEIIVSENAIDVCGLKGQKLDMTKFFENKEITGYYIEDKDEKRLASVTKKGMLTIKKKGNVAVTGYKLVKNELGKNVKVPLEKVRLELLTPAFQEKSVKLRYEKEFTDLSKLIPDLEKASVGNTVTWKSSKEKVATVENGVVSANATGKTKVTVTFERDGKKKNVSINVVVKIPKHAKENVSIKIDQEKKISLKNVDSTQKIEWKSLNPAVASVTKDPDKLGKAILLGKSEGEAVIIAKVDGNEYPLTVNVLPQ